MTYTFEDFKREHSKEIVEKFKNAWGYLREDAITIDEYYDDNLQRFCWHAFGWHRTSDGWDFWNGVSNGKHRKPVAAESPKVPAIENPQEKNMLKQKWQQLTMALGVWLIGSRFTPSENASRIGYEICHDQMEQAIRDRDKARKSSDDYRDKLEKMTNVSVAVERKYKRLEKRYEALAKTSSKKPKAKRVKK